MPFARAAVVQVRVDDEDLLAGRDLFQNDVVEDPAVLVERVIRVLGVRDVQLCPGFLEGLGPLGDLRELVGLEEDLVPLERVVGAGSLQTGVAIVLRQVVKHIVPLAVDFLEADDIGGLFNDGRERLRGISALPAAAGETGRVDLDIVAHHGKRKRQTDLREKVVLPLGVGAVLGRVPDRDLVFVDRAPLVAEREHRDLRGVCERALRLADVICIAQDGAADLNVGDGGERDGVVRLFGDFKDAVGAIPVAGQGEGAGFDLDDVLRCGVERTARDRRGRNDRHADLDVLLPVSGDQRVDIVLVRDRGEGEPRRIQDDRSSLDGTDGGHALSDLGFGRRRSRRRDRRLGGFRRGLFVFGLAVKAAGKGEDAEDGDQKESRQANARA